MGGVVGTGLRVGVADDGGCEGEDVEQATNSRQMIMATRRDFIGYSFGQDGEKYMEKRPLTQLCNSCYTGCHDQYNPTGDSIAEIS